MSTTRTPLSSRPHLRRAFAAFGIVGALAGCAAQTTADTAATVSTSTAASSSAAAGSATTSSSSTGSTSSAATSAVTGSDSTYADGTYTASGSYTSPGGQESVTVEVTLADDVVTAVTVTPQATSGNSLRYQTAFAENVASEVVGVDIDSLSVSKVAGSSLTSGGFNAAIAEIKSEASA